jgi:hypothetical protein
MLASDVSKLFRTIRSIQIIPPKSCECIFFLFSVQLYVSITAEVCYRKLLSSLQASFGGVNASSQSCRTRASCMTPAILRQPVPSSNVNSKSPERVGSGWELLTISVIHLTVWRLSKIFDPLSLLYCVYFISFFFWKNYISIRRVMFGKQLGRKEVQNVIDTCLNG